VIKNSGTIVYSPSDLTLHMSSPFASWMARFALERPDELPDKDEHDELMDLLQQRGYAHEDAVEVQFKNDGKTVRRIDGASQKEKRVLTLQAMEDGIDVIVQGLLERAPFAGYPDFLVKKCGSSVFGDYFYEVWDAKLSRSPKISFMIQLCCYAEMLESVQGVLPPQIVIFLGSGELSINRTNDYFAYYKNLQSAFLDAQERFDANSRPDPFQSKNWGAWSGFAQKLLVERDHLSRIAGITRSQIKKLNHK